MPTLVLVGEADIGDVFAYSGAIEAAVPLASFEIWKNTGHLIQIQRPAELISRFNRFVALASRKEANVSETKLAAYVGHYKLFNRSANVALREGHLVLEFPGDPYYWLFAASETKFFLRTEERKSNFKRTRKAKSRRWQSITPTVVWSEVHALMSQALDDSYSRERPAVHEDRSRRFGRTMLAVFESRKEMSVPAVQLNCLES